LYRVPRLGPGGGTKGRRGRSRGGAQGRLDVRCRSGLNRRWPPLHHRLGCGLDMGRGCPRSFPGSFRLHRRPDVRRRGLDPSGLQGRLGPGGDAARRDLPLDRPNGRLNVGSRGPRRKRSRSGLNRGNARACPSCLFGLHRRRGRLDVRRRRPHLAMPRGGLERTAEARSSGRGHHSGKSRQHRIRLKGLDREDSKAQPS
jgi:hypothetical protein